MAGVVSASARPVTLETVAFALAFCFTSLRIFTGGRPMAAPTGAIIKPFCHSENGKIPKTSAENNRADAITSYAIYNANRFPAAAGGRAMLAPTGAGFEIILSFRKWQLTENCRRA